MTTRLISNPQLWHEHLDAGRREEVCDWLDANGLDPNAVMNTQPVTIEDSPNGPCIVCTVIERDAEQPQQRTVPLVVQPPLHWPVREAEDASSAP